MTTNDKFDHDLVTDDYYKEELEYQKEIDKLNNANSLDENISYRRTDNGLLILFPSNMDHNQISGKLFLYRPSNKHLDFETILSLSEPQMLIPENRLLDGRWNIKIDWKYKGNSYLYKESIVY